MCKGLAWARLSPAVGIVPDAGEGSDAGQPNVSELADRTGDLRHFMLLEPTFLPVEENVAGRADADQQILDYALVGRCLVDPPGMLDSAVAIARPISYGRRFLSLVGIRRKEGGDRSLGDQRQ